MSLELINTGVEANDGTGDPPRQGALKINANFTAVAQALDDLATSDAAHDTAIAALTTSNEAQDTAIDAIVVEQGTQNDAIAAIITATGDQADAIAALQAQPAIYGFTYDQEDEPIGPANGATWRERSAGGLIVGDWEWDSSLAEWTDIRATYIYHSQDVSIAAGAPGDRYRNSSPLIFIPEIKRIVLYGWAISVITPTAMNPGGIGGEVDSSTNYRGFLPTTVNSNNAGVSFPSFAVSTQNLNSAAGASAILTASGKELRTLNEGMNETLFRGLGFISTAVNGGIVGTPPVFNNCRATYKIKFVRG